MTEEDAKKLKNNQEIIHNRYGLCIVKEVIMSLGELFGVVIRPISEKGLKLLHIDSQTNIDDFLEDSTRLMAEEKV